MEAVRDKRPFHLRFNGEKREVIYAPALWEQIMRSTWDWAEPGIIFIDEVNRMNNLWYTETIRCQSLLDLQTFPFPL